MPGIIPKTLYWPYTQNNVIATMRAGIMPAPFTRRMRVVNICSALVLGQIDASMILPFDVRDIHHVLDAVVSQDSIIAQFNSTALTDAIMHGDLAPLIDAQARHPKLRLGLTNGWIQKFILDPFDPLCILLAMRTKLLLDAIDEMGHSFNLIRSIGYGWIDWDGENDPIPPFLPPAYPTPPSNGQPPIIPGGPEIPPGYPTKPPTEQPPIIPGIPSPAGGSGSPGAGTFGYGPGNFGAGGIGGGAGSIAGSAIDCCASTEDPSEPITIGYDTLKMNYGDIQAFTILNYDPGCTEDNYDWSITPDQGTLDKSDPFWPIYTASAAGEDCESPVTLSLICNGETVDAIQIELSSCLPAASISYTTQQMEIDEEQILSAVPSGQCCGTPEFTWTITAGSGTLSAGTGGTVIYTAPHTNPYCQNNPTIELSCAGREEPYDTLKIAVNAYDGIAINVFSNPVCEIMSPTSRWLSLDWNQYKCNGLIDEDSPKLCSNDYSGSETCEYLYQNEGLFDCVSYKTINYLLSITPQDYRTTAKKLGGCCPVQLII